MKRQFRPTTSTAENPERTIDVNQRIIRKRRVADDHRRNAVIERRNKGVMLVEAGRKCVDSLAYDTRGIVRLNRRRWKWLTVQSGNVLAVRR